MNGYKINRVLVPVDLSESSLNALDAAVAIAKKNKASLYVLHVDENNFQTIEDVGTRYFLNTMNSADVITALVGAIQHTHTIKPIVLMEEGNVAEMIMKTSFLQQADLIVIGTHGASGYRDGFIGNNTYNVIKYAGCPVLSVPQKKSLNNLRKILFPVRPVTGALMPYEIVSHFTNPGTIMEVMGLSYNRVVDTGSSVLGSIINEISNQLKEDQVTVKPLWNEGPGIAEEIVKYTSTSSPDLVVITSVLDVTSKPKYIGPHTQKIIHCSKAPVLTIKKMVVPAAV